MFQTHGKNLLRNKNGRENEDETQIKNTGEKSDSVKIFADALLLWLKEASSKKNYSEKYVCVCVTDSRCIFCRNGRQIISWISAPFALLLSIIENLRKKYNEKNAEKKHSESKYNEKIQIGGIRREKFLIEELFYKSH